MSILLLQTEEKETRRERKEERERGMFIMLAYGGRDENGEINIKIYIFLFFVVFSCYIYVLCPPKPLSTLGRLPMVLGR